MKYEYFVNISPESEEQDNTAIGKLEFMKRSLDTEKLLKKVLKNIDFSFWIGVLAGLTRLRNSGSGNTGSVTGGSR